MNEMLDSSLFKFDFKRCIISLIKFFVAILAVTLIVGVILIISKICFCVWQFCYNNDEATIAEEVATNAAEATSDKDSDTPAQKKRLKSLDAFRG